MRKKIRERLKNKGGFTLVELIVVVVIVLILAAALVPSLVNYIDQARRANCKSDAATILSQLEADYAALNSGEEGIMAAAQWQGPGSKISGVTVNLGSNDPEDGTANYEAEVNGTNVISFRYRKGDYIARWTSAPEEGQDAWTVEKVSAEGEQ